MPAVERMRLVAALTTFPRLMRGQVKYRVGSGPISITAMRAAGMVFGGLATPIGIQMG
jgi:hypothetical protein